MFTENKLPSAYCFSIVIYLKVHGITEPGILQIFFFGNKLYTYSYDFEKSVMFRFFWNLAECTRYQIYGIHGF